MAATIFISSTPFDLVLHRQRISETLQQKHPARADVVVTMATSDTSLAERLRLIHSAQVFVAVVGMVYGNVDTTSGKSLMQLEYEEAQTEGIPTLIYLMDEDEHLVLPKHVDTGTSAQKLADFKGRLSLNPNLRFFESAEDLLAKLQNDLLRFLVPVAETPVAAPVASPALTSTGNMDDLLAARKKNEKRYHLTQPRFAFFKEKTSHVLTHDVPDEILKEALEFLLANNSMSASSILARGASIPLDEAIEEVRNLERLVIETVHKLQNTPADTK